MLTKLMLNNTYEIETDDYSLLGIKRRELMQLNLDIRKGNAFRASNKILASDWHILIDIIERKLDIKTARYLYNDEKKVIIFNTVVYIITKESHLITDKMTLAQGMPNPGESIEINMRCTLSNDENMLRFTFDGTVIEFSFYQYVKTMQYIMQY